MGDSFMGRHGQGRHKIKDNHVYALIVTIYSVPLIGFVFGVLLH